MYISDYSIMANIANFCQTLIIKTIFWD